MFYTPKTQNRKNIIFKNSVNGQQYKLNAQGQRINIKYKIPHSEFIKKTTKEERKGILSSIRASNKTNISTNPVGLKVKFKINGKLYSWDFYDKILKNTNSIILDKVKFHEIFKKPNKREIKMLMPTVNTSVVLPPQYGGTCWFHSIMNGIVFSKYARSLLNLRNTNVNKPNSCPSKNASRSVLTNYAKYMLKSGKYVSTNEAIIGSGIRRENESLNGGDLNDFLSIHKKLFNFTDVLDGTPSNYGVTSDVFGIYTKGSSPKSIKIGQNTYNLSHSYIELRKKDLPGRGNHAVSGYVGRDNKFRIFDSRTGSHIMVDWSNIKNDNRILYAINKIDKRYSAKPVPYTSIKGKYLVFVKV